MFVIFYNISVGCRKTGIVQKILAFKMWVKFILSLLRSIITTRDYVRRMNIAKEAL